MGVDKIGIDETVQKASRRNGSKSLILNSQILLQVLARQDHVLTEHVHTYLIQVDLESASYLIHDVHILFYSSI